MAKTAVATLHAPARTASASRPAFLLGVLSGSRSATPLGVLALHHDGQEARGAWRGWPVFRSRLGRGLLVAAMLGELVGDKLPMTPSRTSRGALTGRAVSGAVAGLAVATTTSGPDRRARSAVLGAVGALVGSVGLMRARAAVASRTGLPDPVVALAEDALAVVGSTVVVRRAGRRRA